MSIRPLTLMLAIPLLCSCVSTRQTIRTRFAREATDTQTQAEREEIERHAALAKAVANGLAEIIDSKTSSTEEMVHACYALELMGKNAAPAAKTLARALRHEDPLRTYASRAIIAIGPAAIPVLREQVENPNADIPYTTVKILAQIEVNANVPAAVFRERLNNGTPLQRAEAAWALEYLIQRGVEGSALARNAPAPNEPPAPPPQMSTEEAEIRKLSDEAQHGAADFRVLALNTLATHGIDGRAMAPVIRPLMDDPSPAVSEAAADALLAMGPTAITELTGALASAKPHTRFLAAVVLGNPPLELLEIGIRSQIIAALAQALDDMDPGVRQAAARSLCTYGRTAHPALLRAIKAGNKVVKEEVIELVRTRPAFFNGSFADSVARDPAPADAKEVELGRLLAPDLVARIKGDDAVNRERDLVALNYLPAGSVGKESIAVVGIFMDDPNADITIADAAAFLSSLDPAELPALIETCHDQRKLMRAAAIRVLAKRPEATTDPKIIDTLATAMSDEFEPARLDSFQWALRLKDPSPEVLRNVAASMTNESWYGKEDRIAATEMLGRHTQTPETSVKALIAGLSDLFVEVRIASAISLRAYREKASPALPQLEKQVEINIEPLSREAAETMLVCGPEGRRAVAAYYIQRLTKSEDRETLRSTIGALAEIGPAAAAAVPDLQRWLADYDNDFRIQVAETLGRIGPPSASAIPALSRMVDNSSAEVRYAASAALVKIAPDGKGLAPALLSAVYNRDRTAADRLTAAIRRSGDTRSLIAKLGDIAVNDPEAGVRAAAHRAVEILTVEPRTGAVTRAAGD